MSKDERLKTIDEWNKLSANALETMKTLGNFGPTLPAEDRHVKGYMIDPEGDAGKTYFDSTDLRELAAGMIEVADWLDKRAESDD